MVLGKRYTRVSRRKEALKPCPAHYDVEPGRNVSLEGTLEGGRTFCETRRPADIA